MRNTDTRPAFTQLHISLTADELAALTDEQRDGCACLRCGRDVGELRPVGWLDDCQVFAHAACER